VFEVVHVFGHADGGRGVGDPPNGACAVRGSSARHSTDAVVAARPAASRDHLPDERSQKTHVRRHPTEENVERPNVLL